MITQINVESNYMGLSLSFLSFYLVIKIHDRPESEQETKPQIYCHHLWDRLLNNHKERRKEHANSWNAAFRTFWSCPRTSSCQKTTTIIIKSSSSECWGHCSSSSGRFTLKMHQIDFSELPFLGQSKYVHSLHFRESEIIFRVAIKSANVNYFNYSSSKPRVFLSVPCPVMITGPRAV